MDFLQKRRTRQAQRTAERHYFKFISSYVKSTYKDIFDEAHTMYMNAKQENPGVKDLTKTAFYMRRACPDVVVPRYYNSRKLKSATQKREEHAQMVLNIPLMSKQTTDSLLSATHATATPLQSMPLPNTHATATPLQSMPLPNTAATATPLQSTPQQPEPETESILPLLPEETYMSLLEDLQKDPDLERILNDFPFDDMAGGENGMDQVVADDMVWPSYFTPLEVEVETTFNTLQ